MSNLTLPIERGKSPDTYKAFLIKVEFLSMFNSWGVGKWTALEGRGMLFVVTYDLPQTRERVGTSPTPGPLSAEAKSPGDVAEETTT